MQPEPLQQRLNMCGKAHADAHIAEGIFKNQIPADDPGHQLAQRGIRVGVSRPGDRDHRGQFGVTQPRKHADDGYQHQGKSQRRPGTRAACHGRVCQQVVDERGITDFGSIKFLPGHGRADHGEDARSDDGPDAQRSQRPRPKRLFQRMLGVFRFPDQLINGFAGKQLAWQGSSPRPGRCGRLWMKANPHELGRLCRSVHDEDSHGGSSCCGICRCRAAFFHREGKPCRGDVCPGLRARRVVACDPGPRCVTAKPSASTAREPAF